MRFPNTAIDLNQIIVDNKGISDIHKQKLLSSDVNNKFKICQVKNRKHHKFFSCVFINK